MDIIEFDQLTYAPFPFNIILNSYIFFIFYDYKISKSVAFKILILYLKTYIYHKYFVCLFYVF